MDFLEKGLFPCCISRRILKTMDKILAWPLTWHQAETCMGALGHAIRKAASPSSSSHASLMLLGISCHLFKQHPAMDSHTQWLATSIMFWRCVCQQYHLLQAFRFIHAPWRIWDVSSQLFNEVSIQPTLTSFMGKATGITRWAPTTYKWSYNPCK